MGSGDVHIARATVYSFDFMVSTGGCPKGGCSPGSLTMDTGKINGSCRLYSDASVGISGYTAVSTLFVRVTRA